MGMELVFGTELLTPRTHEHGAFGLVLAGGGEAVRGVTQPFESHEQLFRGPVELMANAAAAVAAAQTGKSEGIALAPAVQLVWWLQRPSAGGPARCFIDKCARSPASALADLQLERCDQVSVDETVGPSVALCRCLGPVELLSVEMLRTVQNEGQNLAKTESAPDPELEPEPEPEPQRELEKASITISMTLEHPLEDGLYRLRIAGEDSEVWWRVAGCADWRQVQSTPAPAPAFASVSCLCHLPPTSASASAFCLCLCLCL